MKTLTKFALIAASALSLAAGAASAQPMPMRDHWIPIGQREADLNHRIDTGVQSGQLTRREAMRLRHEFHDIQRLEDHYRANGLTPPERADLDRRFDRLSAEIHIQKHDNQYDGGYGHGPR